MGFWFIIVFNFMVVVGMVATCWVEKKKFNKTKERAIVDSLNEMCKPDKN